MIGLTQQEQVEFERIKDEMWDYGYETAKEEFGWHPASELPPLDDKKNSKPVIAICGIPDPLNYGRVLPRFSAVIGGAWADKDVKWWCYPPEEE